VLPRSRVGNPPRSIAYRFTLPDRRVFASAAHALSALAKTLIPVGPLFATATNSAKQVSQTH
jgi:hypothetical protein